VFGRQFIERPREPQEFTHVGFGRCDLRRQLRDVKFRTALQRAPLAHKINDQAAHDPCRISDEPLAIRKVSFARRHPEVGFMEQSRWADRHAGIAP